MSGTADDPTDPDLLAAEYVLGLMADPERSAFNAADPAAAASVAAWNARLEPLASLAGTSAPSDMLWARISRDLPRPASAAAISPARRGRGIWPVLAFGNLALAACLAAALLLSGHRLQVRVAWDAPRPAAPVAPSGPVAPAPPPPAAKTVEAAPLASKAPEPRAVALLTAPSGERPAMKAFWAPDRTLRLVAIQRVSVPAGKALGFWVWPRGTARPILVGRLPRDGGSLQFPFGAEDGTPVMVTLEPRDLPATGDQGPTLFQGQIVLMN